jgi:threonine/homoserine/homoserine lactone efflux protein
MQMQWILVVLIQIAGCGFAAWAGIKFARSGFEKKEIARKEAEKLKVQREMHDAKRTHLPREGAPSTRVTKATFRGRE